MDKQRWQQIEPIYFAALERRADERRRFLDTACADDEALRHEVEALLVCNEQAGDFLSAPPFENAAKMLAADPPPEAATQPMPVAQSLHHIGPYRLRTPLGKGGMGEVYLALDTRLNRKVAIKLLPAQFTHEADRVRRFAQEARAASALNHPNILTIYEIGKAPLDKGEVHYIVTEYVEGETLRKEATSAAEKPLPLTTVLEIATQITAALAAAHEAGIIHRDIKPENIMVRRDGLVKVLDFGLAKLSETRNAECGMRNEDAETLLQSSQDTPHSAFRIPHSTLPGIVMGTPRYMSPEQARGQKVDVRTDLFSLGIMLYELIAGKPPFPGTSPMEVISEILVSEPKALHSLRADVPARLEKIIHRLLRKEREKRYPSAQELLTDLKACQQELAAQTVPQWWPQHLNRKALWMGSAGVALFVLLGSWLWLVRPPASSKPLSSEFSEMFVDVGRWTAPPAGWEIRDERLLVNQQPLVGYVTNLPASDFTMTFHLRLENADGATWALRIRDPNNYYLFCLSGAGEKKTATSYFTTYIVRAGQLGVSVSRIPVTTKLSAGGEYTINITAKGNEITHQINSAAEPSRDVLGDPLGYFKDENSTFSIGSIGFRTVAQERFSVDELYVRPLSLQSQQAPERQ